MPPRYFSKKLRGAIARLFAEVCLFYSEEVEGQLFTPPTGITPIFNWLSPHQRLALIRDLAVGLLCPSETLPPQTLAHYVAYQALVQTLCREIGSECDMVMDRINLDESSDLLLADNRPQPTCTPKEKEELRLKRALVSRQAEKFKGRLEKHLDAGRGHADGDFRDSAPSGRETLSIDEARMIRDTWFAGSPISRAERDGFRTLTESEEYAFHWRLLCEAALQDLTDAIPFPLHFDFRCPDSTKWMIATNSMLNGATVGCLASEADLDLVLYRIDVKAYADKSQHPRIMAVEKIVRDLRASYDPYWNPAELAVDQRCIFALCSYNVRGQQAHHPWIADFITNCNHRGFDFFNGESPYYQRRYNIWKEMELDYPEGLNTGWHSPDSLGVPTDFVHEDPLQYLQCCHASECHGNDRENLKLCSGCKTVYYCSRECQLQHWSEHKKQCKEMAVLRKDKEKVTEIANNEL